MNGIAIQTAQWCNGGHDSDGACKMAHRGNELTDMNCAMPENAKVREWIFSFAPFTCCLCERERSMQDTIRHDRQGFGTCVCDWYLDRLCEPNPSGTWADRMELLLTFLSCGCGIVEDAYDNSARRTCGKHEVRATL